jgi:hypothetical protein
MKNLFLVLLLLVVCSLSTSVAQARGDSFGMSWSSAIATGNTSDFVSGFQARGINVEYRKRVNSNYLWGLNVGYNVFAETGNSTVNMNHVQATGIWGKYVNTVPIYLAAFYEFGPYQARSGRFYVGMNAGTAWLEQRATLSSFALENDNWHMAVAPEIGYHLPWNSFVGHVSVRYNYVFEAGETEAQSWLEFRVGFGL